MWYGMVMVWYDAVWYGMDGWIVGSRCDFVILRASSPEKKMRLGAISSSAVAPGCRKALAAYFNTKHSSVVDTGIVPVAFYRGPIGAMCDQHYRTKATRKTQCSSAWCVCTYVPPHLWPKMDACSARSTNDPSVCREHPVSVDRPTVMPKSPCLLRTLNINT